MYISKGIWCQFNAGIAIYAQGNTITKKMKTGIMNLNRWAEKTAQAVRNLCLRKNAPCVGFGLAFFDPMADENERWNFVIELAYDPHNPPSDEEKEQLEKALEFLSRGIAHIMGGSKEDINLDDLIVHGDLH